MISKERAMRLANREVQRAYRERHAEDLRKARRVSTSLMGLRSVHAKLTPKQEAYRTGATLGSVADLLSDFLTGEEFETLIKVLRFKKSLRMSRKAVKK